MDRAMTRRQWLRILGASGAAAGLGALAPAHAPAGEAPPPAEVPSGFESSVIASRKVQDNRTCPTLAEGKVIQPQRELPVLATTDVLVVGGGSAGVAAAIAARRTGAETILVERYGHFGGLWSGGLVLVVIGHIVRGGKQVCQGIGEEMMRRLDGLDGAIIDRKPGRAPTVDAEALKYIMVEMIEEAEVGVFLHSWGVDAILEGNAVRGAVFESKSGRQAILAKVVVDATGDGDLFAAAGAAFEHRSHNIGLVSRLGHLDRVDAEKAKDAPKPKHLGLPTPAPGVNWVNMHGPEVDGLDVAVLTRLEMNHRKFIWRSIQKTRATPGYEKVYLVETAPQLGVRITRVLAGLETVAFADPAGAADPADPAAARAPSPNCIGVGGSSDGRGEEWQIPYGALVPETVDNILAAGRCISAEIRMADLVRLIPNCCVTGHAAGVAAAVAAKQGCRPREVDVAEVQKILKEQGAYLG
ncbi:MAG: FAD-dependent oxidoreductase [Planctomycetes bacterium]|nr:FAD-dependent oxidoreductase [Planctomycetota bacterium]